MNTQPHDRYLYNLLKKSLPAEQVRQRLAEYYPGGTVAAEIERRGFMLGEKEISDDHGMTIVEEIADDILKYDHRRKSV